MGGPGRCRALMNHGVSATAPSQGKEGGGAGRRRSCKPAGLSVLWAPQSFHFPLFMTMLHLAVIFLFSALSRALVQCSSHRARVVLSWTDYLRRVAPTGTWPWGSPGPGRVGARRGGRLESRWPRTKGALVAWSGGPLHPPLPLHPVCLPAALLLPLVSSAAPPPYTQHACSHAPGKVSNAAPALTRRTEATPALTLLQWDDEGTSEHGAAGAGGSSADPVGRASQSMG